MCLFKSILGAFFPLCPTLSTPSVLLPVIISLINYLPSDPCLGACFERTQTKTEHIVHIHRPTFQRKSSVCKLFCLEKTPKSLSETALPYIAVFLWYVMARRVGEWLPWTEGGTGD